MLKRGDCIIADEERFLKVSVNYQVLSFLVDRLEFYILGHTTQSLKTQLEILL